MFAILTSAQVIGQRYVVLRPLREEPWGGVYLAQDRLLKVEVGLKFIGREEPDFDQAREILLQEAALAYKLRHPLILSVFHGAEAEDGFYLVQEPYKGESLLARLNRRDRFTLPQALHLLDQVGRAVTFAHEQGAIHQSLTPLNILLEGDKVKVANFASRPAPERQVGLLELRAYAAPETVRQDLIIPQSNVFSLGVLGFRLTAGSLPYSLTFDEPFPYRLETPPPDLDQIPVPLQNFLLGCLAPEPQDRYADIPTCLVALEQARHLWRTPPPKRFFWQSGTGLALGESARNAAQRFWEESKTQATRLVQKLKPAAAEAAQRIRAAPPRLFWGLGLALLTVILIWVGAQTVKQGLGPSRPAATAAKAKPTPAAHTPSKAAQRKTGTRLPSIPGPFVSAKGKKSAPHLGAVLPPAAPTDKYLVLVASYTKLKPALALRNRLQARNLTARAVKTTPRGKTVYQVRVGPVRGKAAAEKVARLIQQQERVKPQIVRLSSRSNSASRLRRRQ
ncbi:MAG: protein kinase [Deltaproteobacteria bacterium]|nr:protein kinase [Deltaproteobacteria bacterium]